MRLQSWAEFVQLQIDSRHVHLSIVFFNPSTASLPIQLNSATFRFELTNKNIVQLLLFHFDTTFKCLANSPPQPKNLNYCHMTHSNAHADIGLVITVIQVDDEVFVKEQNWRNFDELSLTEPDTSSLAVVPGWCSCHK